MNWRELMNGWVWFIVLMFAIGAGLLFLVVGRFFLAVGS